MSNVTEPVHEFTMYRTANHPEFIASVIVPTLEAQGMDVGCASAVAGLMDTYGFSADAAVADLSVVLESYGTPPTADGESLARDQRER